MVYRLKARFAKRDVILVDCVVVVAVQKQINKAKEFVLIFTNGALGSYNSVKLLCIILSLSSYTSLFVLMFQVCEHHFLESDFVDSTSYTDSMTGKVIEVPLKLRRLKPSAIPSVFPNCPAYLSRQETSARESPEEKRARVDAEALQEAIRLSEQSHEAEEKKNAIATFEDLLTAVGDLSLTDFWTKVVTQQQVLFLNFSDQGAPVVHRAVTVASDLSLAVYVGEMRLQNLGSSVLPMTISDLRVLHKVLCDVEDVTKDSTNNELQLEILLKRVVALLEQLSSSALPHEWQVQVVKFVTQQLQVLLTKASTYPADFLVFCSLVYTISPHAYRFIRSTAKLKLPHPQTIRRICASYRASPSREQQEDSFLSYARRLASTLKDHERFVTLMMDEIHLQASFQYKGGYVTGAATNNENAAKTAYVFMIQSLLSSNKDVVHILPVAQIEAKQLHEFLDLLIRHLEDIGIRVVAVVSDNNSINRKAMSFFADPPKVSIVYRHPSDSSRPLFFILDAVHILKCIRNNWLNQRNCGRCIFFPNFSALSENPSVLTASFNTLCKLHEGEKNELLRLAPTLSFKSLNPSNLERQNVKLALRIFNSSTAAALRSTKVALEHKAGTLELINIVLTWWNVVNVKTPFKGQRLRDPFQEPISALQCHQIEFLNKIVDWLDHWQSLKHDAGQLTRETHMALRHTSHALVEVSTYCIEELRFKYVLLGKFQTDSLEDRFGRYRQLSGAQYHVSIRQIYESEQKLRLQKLLDLPNLDTIAPCIPTTDLKFLVKQFDVAVMDDDVKEKEKMLPAITYVAGYCAYAAVRKLACSSCQENLTVENRTIELDDDVLIANATRGGLKFPQAVVVNAVLTMEIVLDKLRSPKYASQFFACAKQKEVLVSLATSLVECNEDLDFCDGGHSPELVLNYVLSAAANTLLNNLCKVQNNKLNESKAAKRNKVENKGTESKAAKRKLSTLQA